MNLWDILLSKKSERNSKEFDQAVKELENRNYFEALPKTSIKKIDPASEYDYTGYDAVSPFQYGLRPDALGNTHWIDHPDAGRHGKINILLDQYPREYVDTEYQLLHAHDPSYSKWEDLVKKLELIKESKKLPKLK